MIRRLLPLASLLLQFNTMPALAQVETLQPDRVAAERTMAQNARVEIGMLPAQEPTPAPRDPSAVRAQPPARPLR